MVRVPSILVAAAVALAVAGQPAASLGEVPRPPNARIVPPGPAVPKECAEFSGAWAGIWTRVRQAFNIWVVQVARDCRVRVIYAWDSPTGTGKSGYSPAPIEGTIANGVLSFQFRPSIRGELTLRIEMRRGPNGMTAAGIPPRLSPDVSAGPLTKFAQ